MSGPTDSAFLDALRGVHWPARRPVAGAVTGTHTSRLRGVSAEFTEYRPYRQGDEPRRIDWKLLARSNRAYIRLANDRSVLTTVVVADASASMAFPEATRSEAPWGKWEQCRRLTIGLAAVAHADGDPVGAVVPTERGAWQMEPRTRRGVVAEIARALSQTTPGGTPPLAPAVRAVRPGARVAIVSDFLGDADDVLAAARVRLAAGWEVFAVHVVARDELEPPARAFLASDPEDPSVERPLVEETRREYEAAFARWRDELAAAWRAAGGSYTMVVAEEATERAVRRIATPQTVTAARA